MPRFRLDGLPADMVISSEIVRFDGRGAVTRARSEEHTSELQSQSNLVCRLLLEKKKSAPPLPPPPPPPPPAPPPPLPPPSPRPLLPPPPAVPAAASRPPGPTTTHAAPRSAPFS